MRNTIYILAAMAVGIITGCSVADNENSYYNFDPETHEGSGREFNNEISAIFTIKQDAAGVTFFQLDDETRLYPGDGYPFSGQVRAMGSLKISPEIFKDYGFVTQVLWAEPLEEGHVVSGSVLAEDGVDISNSWMTSVEDGYITIHYSCWWGNEPNHHDFYIVTGKDPSDPYSIELRHGANGDGRDTYDEGLVFFDINGLPDTGGAVKDLTLKWTGTNGETQTRKFGFRTRK